MFFEGRGSQFGGQRSETKYAEQGMRKVAKCTRGGTMTVCDGDTFPKQKRHPMIKFFQVLLFHCNGEDCIKFVLALA